MTVDSIFLLIIYIFSMLGVLMGLYALWCIIDLQDEIKKLKKVRRAPTVLQSKKPSSTWPPR